MGRILIVLLMFTIMFFSCDNLTDEKTETTLTINNLSDFPLLNVEYSTEDFGIIKSGSDITKEVSACTKYIFFSLLTNTSGIVRCKTEPFTCSVGTNNVILIENKTIITITVSEKTDTLKNICNSLGVSGQYYSIGDIGPGGGIVFFAQGGQYKEVSGELGSYNFATATTTARNFNGGRFTNWYLPDRGELQLIYENLYKLKLGNFYKDNYWSSTFTSDTSNYIYFLNFENGSWKSDYGDYRILRTIAVRNFNY